MHTNTIHAHTRTHTHTRTCTLTYNIQHTNTRKYMHRTLILIQLEQGRLKFMHARPHKYTTHTHTCTPWADHTTGAGCKSSAAKVNVTHARMPRTSKQRCPNVCHRLQRTSSLWWQHQPAHCTGITGNARVIFSWLTCKLHSQGRRHRKLTSQSKL